MSIVSNLYPPTISTYMPAFIRTEECKIYFSISSLNQISDIKNVQMVVRYQSNNLSALDENIYSSEIKICQLKKESGEYVDRYYVTLSPNDLETKIFETNQFYQIQLRFTDTAAATVPSNGRIENWLIENNKYFSEWSTICLVRGINKPNLVVNNFNINTLNNYKSDILTVSAQLQYADTTETEKIKSYNLELYSESKILLEQSGIQLNKNSFDFSQINYTFRSELINNSKYVLVISYNTYNGYSEELIYNFIAKPENVPFTFDMTLIGESNEELGINTIIFSANNIDTTFSGNFIIKRSSSEDEFKYWDTLYYLNIPAYNAKNVQYIWNDLTPKMGVWYKYAVQYVNLEGNKSTLIRERDDTAFVLFTNSAFLTEDNQLLTLKYDTQISSIKRTNMETITNTLGHQYPIIRRNGNTNYRQFPLTGTITLLSDNGELFARKRDILKNDYQNNKYNEYTNENNITLLMNDVIVEREFRDLVEKFLSDGKVKLFRSATEGNILVRLTDVSVTPIASLGRRICSFSATATEIGQDNITNYFKYGISSKTFKKPIYEYYLRAKDYDRTTDTVTVSPSQVVNAEEAIILNRRIIGYEEIEGDEFKW